MGTKSGQGTVDALKWIAEQQAPGTPMHTAALRAAARIEAQLTPAKKHVSQVPLSKILRVFRKPK